MHGLELRIPPPVVALLMAAIMWGISLAAPPVAMPAPLRVATAIAIALAGAVIAVAGVIALRRAKTTVSPLKPETTSSIVTSGVYGFTRNPMYVGLALALLAWAVFVSSAWALLALAGFVLYMNRFQIVPEERVLAAQFGASYSAYRARVRRWL
jgi:protein-S-isoprenylcysteine O-methyltransferase Ste14